MHLGILTSQIAPSTFWVPVEILHEWSRVCPYHNGKSTTNRKVLEKLPWWQASSQDLPTDTREQEQPHLDAFVLQNCAAKLASEPLDSGKTWLCPHCVTVCALGSQLHNFRLHRAGGMSMDQSALTSVGQMVPAPLHRVGFSHDCVPAPLQTPHESWYDLSADLPPKQSVRFV